MIVKFNYLYILNVELNEKKLLPISKKNTFEGVNVCLERIFINTRG